MGIVFVAMGVALCSKADLAASSIHHVGLGTLVTTVINSPLIALMGRAVDRFFGQEPLFPRWESLLKRK